jgi:hypothetical protein
MARFQEFFELALFALHFARYGSRRFFRSSIKTATIRLPETNVYNCVSFEALNFRRLRRDFVTHFYTQFRELFIIPPCDKFFHLGLFTLFLNYLNTPELS